MKKLKAVLLDDDPFIHEIIKDLTIGSSLVEIVEWFSCPKKFLMAGVESKYDLYLLDIAMPHVNGFMIAERLKSRPFIFITGVSAMLQDAIELAPVDIVMKPIKKERLDSAFEKAYKLQVKNNQDLQKKIELFYVAGSRGKIKITLSDIVYVVSEENDHRNKKAFLKNGCIYTLMNCTHQELLKLCPNLIQVNRSELISLEIFHKIEYDDITLNLNENGKEKHVTLSRVHRYEFITRFEL